MDRGSHLPNAHVSQTQLEHRDLIQYECNLAACYEAEYLLSLKIQEEMCQQKDAYNDPSEITCQFMSPATDTASLNGGHNIRFNTQETLMDCSHGDGVGQFLPGFVNPSENGRLRLGPSEGKFMAANLRGQEQPHYSHEGAGIDTINVFSRQRDDDCGASEDHLMHPDGPSRKKMCLNRAEYPDIEF